MKAKGNTQSESSNSLVSSNAPVFEVRLNHIRCTVWRNTGENGSAWFNTQVCRRFKSDGNWSESHAFTGLADLALVAEACRLARDFIASQELYSMDSE